MGLFDRAFRHRTRRKWLILKYIRIVNLWTVLPKIVLGRFPGMRSGFFTASILPEECLKQVVR
jgi:hypothetical protein